MSSSPGCGRVVAELEQSRLQLRVELAAEHEAAVLERQQKLGGDPRRGRFLRAPRVGEPFDAVGVRVLRRGEPSFRERELAKDVVERLLDDASPPLVPRDRPGVEVGRGEEGVVVQHLLEVRHEPAVVDRVAVEAAADQVVHATGGHAVERLL